VRRLLGWVEAEACDFKNVTSGMLEVPILAEFFKGMVFNAKLRKLRYIVLHFFGHSFC